MSAATILAIDQGTTGTKAHRLRPDGTFETIARFEHRQILPQSGWVEHDPEELMRHVQAALVAGDRPAAVGLANQGETVVAWDARTKRPLYNAIVWQDSRSADMTERLKAEGAEELTRNRAGLPLDPYFSATKLRWLLDNSAEARPLLREGRLRLGTSDAFFLDRLTGTFATDVTTASRTSLMNLATLSWDPELCALFGVPAECLPDIRSSAGPFGETHSGVPVAASITDQQAALFGHGCRESGQSKITFGTGAFALALCGTEPILDQAGALASTVAWKLRDLPCRYALEGGIYNAASAVNWARGIGLFHDFTEIEDFKGETALSDGSPSCRHCQARCRIGIAARPAFGWVWVWSDGPIMRPCWKVSPFWGPSPADNEPSRAAYGAAVGRRRHGQNGYFCLSWPMRSTDRWSFRERGMTGYGTALLAMIGAGLAEPQELPPQLPARAFLEPTAPCRVPIATCSPKQSSAAGIGGDGG
jgi:glycerol kinase